MQQNITIGTKSIPKPLKPFKEHTEYSVNKNAFKIRFHLFIDLKLSAFDVFNELIHSLFIKGV